MPVLFVIPGHKSLYPFPGRIQAGKALSRPLGAVLQGAKQRLRVRIIIADPWPTPRGCNPKLNHLAQQCAGLHRYPIVRVQDQWLPPALLTQRSALQELKNAETNQQVSDFHTTEGSVNGSLTDRHYPHSAPFYNIYYVLCRLAQDCKGGRVQWNRKVINSRERAPHLVSGLRSMDRWGTHLYQDHDLGV